MAQKTAVAYYRTSSAAGLGDDKDSETRQRDAVTKYAKANKITIVAEYYDAAVKGTDSVADRPEFAKMLEYLHATGTKTVLVETANRFARDLIVQLTGHEMLKEKGIALIPVDIPDHFINETPTAIMVRQILGAVAEFEKAALVDKLRKGRERKKALTGWCGGRRPVPPETITAARTIARNRKLPLRAIATRLAAQGHLAPSGKPYGPESIKRMVNR